MEMGDLIGLIVVVCLVAIPALAFSVRLALRPIVESILRVREAFAGGPLEGAAGRRLQELEREVQRLRGEVADLSRAQEFYEELRFRPPDAAAHAIANPISPHRVPTAGAETRSTDPGVRP